MKLIDKKECGNCLSDMIGFASCDKPAECLQLTSIGGISEDLLSSISDPSKHNNFYEVFDDAKRNAYLNFTQDILSNFGKKGSFGHELLSSEDISIYKPNKVFLHNKTYIGQAINFSNSKFQVLDLKSIKFYSNGTGSIDIKVIDTSTGIELFQKLLIPVNSGLNIIEINEHFTIEANNEMLVIQVDPSASLSGKLFVSTCGKHCVGCGCKCTTIQNTSQGAYQYNNVSEFNTGVNSSETFFCADYSINCDIDKVICENKTLLGYAYMLKVYIELINLQITSPRINYLSESNLEAIQKVILPEKKKEYYTALDRAVRNMLTTKLAESACFSCIIETDTSVRFVDRN